MQEASPSNYRWIIVALFWLAHVIQFFNYSSLGIFAPFFKEEMNLSSAQVGFFASAVNFGGWLSTIPAGFMIDRIGVRVILSLSLALMGLIWILFSYIPSYEGIIVILLLYGVVYGTISPAASKGIRSWFPPIGRATAMGVKQTGVNIGGILAGVILPFLALSFSWRRSLLIVGVTQAACTGVFYPLLKDRPSRVQEGTPPMNWRKALPVLLNRNILTLGGAGFLSFACQYSFYTYLVLFLTKELNRTVVQAGLFYALAFFVGGAGRVLWSMVSDYLLGGRRKGILILVTWFQLFSLLTLSLISFFPALSRFVLIPVLTFGISAIGNSALFLTILAESTQEESAGVATSVGFFFGYMGSFLCTPLFGHIVDLAGLYGYGWLFLTLFSGLTILFLGYFREKNFSHQ